VETGRHKTANLHQHSYSLESHTEYFDTMPTNADDLRMGGAQLPPITMEDIHHQLSVMTAAMEDLTAETATLKQAMRRAEEGFDRLQDELGDTRVDLSVAKEELRQLKQHGSTQSPHPKNEAKGADPPMFIGDQKQLEGWITACRLRFAGQPSKFDSEEKKVIFASSFLKGPPMAWFQPVITAFAIDTEDPPPEFLSFETFVQSIRALYGDPNLQRNAETALRFLMQGDRSVAEYISRFATHSQYTRYDDPSRTGYFYHGLNGAIKDQLVTREWKNLKELQAIATKLDARARERKFEKEHEAKDPRANATVPPRRVDGTFLPNKAPAWGTTPRQAPTQPQPPTTPAVDGSSPMELDHQRLAPLSREEKERCIREGRCFRCRKAGHNSRDCQGLPSRVFVSEVQLSENDGAQE
jgi:Retrotransposon gag protein